MQVLLSVHKVDPKIVLTLDVNVKTLQCLKTLQKGHDGPEVTHLSLLVFDSMICPSDLVLDLDFNPT